MTSARRPRGRSWAGSRGRPRALPRRPPRRRAGDAGGPVYVPSRDVADAQGDGGLHYCDLSKMPAPARWIYPALLRSWDGGPVEVAGTVQEGEDVAGFRVVHCPGHAPGLIALWRESDRLALSSDVFYTANPERFTPGPPRVPHAAFNLDTEQARAASASSRRSSPPPPGPATPSRSPATYARSWSGPPTPPSGAPQPPARATLRAEQRLRGRGRRRADAAGRDDPEDAARPTAPSWPVAAVAGGRVAARGRVPVRAPRRALDDRRRARSRVSASCSRASAIATPAERAAVRDALRVHLAENFPELPHAVIPDPARFADLLARLLPRGRRGPAGARALRRSRRAAAARAAALDPRARGWPLLRVSLPGEEDGFFAPARDVHLDGFPPLALAEAQGADASLRIIAPDNTRALARVDPERIARAARRAEPVREAALARRWSLTLWPTAGLGAGGRHGAGRVGGLRARALFLDRADPVAAWLELRAFQDGLIERLRDARELRIEADGTDLRLRVEGARGSTPTASATCPAGGLHLAAGGQRDRHHPLHRPLQPGRRRGRRHRADLPRRRGARRPRRARRALPAAHARHRSGRPPPGRDRDRHQRRHRPRRSATSSSTRRSPARCTSRSVAATPRRAASTSPPCTGT